MYVLKGPPDYTHEGILLGKGERKEEKGKFEKTDQAGWLAGWSVIAYIGYYCTLYL